MTRLLSPIGIVCAIVGIGIVASLITGKTIYIGRGSIGTQVFYERDVEPTSYWLCVFALILLFCGLLFGTLSGFADR